MDAITELAGAAMGGVQSGECEQCEGCGEYPVEDDRGVERYLSCSKCDGTGEYPAPLTGTPLTAPLAILGQGDYITTIEE